MKLKYANIIKNLFETLTMGRDSVRDKQRPSGNWKGPQYYLRFLKVVLILTKVSIYLFRCYNFENRRPGVVKRNRFFSVWNTVLPPEWEILPQIPFNKSARSEMRAVPESAVHS